MNSFKRRLVAALGGLGLLVVLALAQGHSLALFARTVLGLGAVGALTWWAARAKAGRSSTDAAPPRLAVVHRVGLSQRSGAVLVEVDGQAYLIVHGDGFARIQRAGPPAQADRRVLPPSATFAAALDSSRGLS